MKKLECESIPMIGRRSMYSGIVRSSNQNSLTKKELTASEGEVSSIDEKCRIILSEIDRCVKWKSRLIESSVLHNVSQVFVTTDLYNKLEAELDKLLVKQLLQEEQKFTDISSSSERVEFREVNYEENPPAEDTCLACHSCPCSWKSYCDIVLLEKRKDSLCSELVSVQKCHDSKIIRSIVTQSAINGGDTEYLLSDLVEELSHEIKEIDTKIKLCMIDSELHRMYATRSETVTIRSIHGFDTTLKRDDAIVTLEYNHNHHIGALVARETINNVLEWMLEGWYFGERDTKRGSSSINEISTFDDRGSIFEKASDIQMDSNYNARRTGKDAGCNVENLKSIETNMKYGIFCLMFMYFRAVHLARCEKVTWSVTKRLASMTRGRCLSAKRVEMIQEVDNAEYRRARLEHAMGKARIGEERKRYRIERDRLEKSTIKHFHNKRVQSLQRLAMTIQRVYRGHLGRIDAKMRHDQRNTLQRENSLMNACATVIAKIWRGYCGRIDAKCFRQEMVEFLYAIREEEAKFEKMDLTRQIRWFREKQTR